MAKLDNFEAFMQPVVEETKEVVISERFKDKNGKVQKVVLKGLSSEETQRIIQDSSRRGDDDLALTRRMIVECMVSPNLKDKALCDYYKVYDPEDLVLKIFSQPSEYKKLAEEVTKLLKIKTDAQLREDAKN